MGAHAMHRARGASDATFGRPAPGRADLALQGVYTLSKILGQPGNLEQVLDQSLVVIGSYLDMRHGLIVLFDDRRPGHFHAHAAVASGWREGSALDRFASLPDHVAGRIVAGREPLTVEDVESDATLAEWPWGAPPVGRRLAFLGAPIFDGGDVVGLLAVERIWDPRQMPDFAEEARFLAMASAMIGQTVHLYDLIARDRRRLMEEQRLLEKCGARPTPSGEQALTGIVGASRAMRGVFEQINIVARTHTSLLLRGESGTGKALFARAAHDLSPRADKPFVRVNCAALSETLLELELFGQETTHASSQETAHASGHEQGAFSGAAGRRQGRFEQADKGTLFLDEIGSISAAFQAKLLRVLQEGEFERVGGSETINVDIRFIFATDRNLEEAVERGAFRADLYYRINVVSVLLPPLRERPEDIGLLAQEFLRRFNDENGARKSLPAGALDMLQRCYFPGNVRELENCVRRAATLARQDALSVADFACGARACLSSTLSPGFSSAPARPRVEAFAPPASAADLAEREKLIGAMEKAGWVQAKAARLLRLTPRQVAYALGKHGIAVKKF